MRSSNWLLILFLFCLSQFSTPVMGQPKRIPSGQNGRTKSSNPSHRRLPIHSDRPLKALANNPELLELRKRYNQLRRQERDMKRDSRVIPRDGETMEQALQRNDAITEKLRLNLPVTESFESESRSFYESLGQGLGEAISETFKPGSVKFDPNAWDPVRLREQIYRKQREVRQEIDKAEKLLKEKWPTDTVAPHEWLEKVQPFINTEVIEQLTEASRQFDDQKHLPPSERRFQDVEKIRSLGDKPGSMFDSFMTSIDKQGTDWLKSSGKEKSSLWKSLKDTATSGITSLNRSMTENSRRQANSPAMRPSNSIQKRPTPTIVRPKSPASASSPQTNPRIWMWGGGLAALLGIVALAYYYRDKFFQPQSRATRAKDPILAARIQDRDTLLSACHTLARQLFGVRSRFWNHRRLFESLSENLAESSDRGQRVVDQLSRIYETARYAPVQVAADEFSRARDLFSALQDELQTSA